MTASNPIREALRHTVDTLIPAGHAYIIDGRGPWEISRKRSNCFQVVAETMVYRNREFGLTVHLPFDPSHGVSGSLLRFMEWPLRHFFDRYMWQGIPCFALRLGQEPRWTPENRPVVDGSKPASGRAPQARVFYSGPA